MSGCSKPDRTYKESRIAMDTVITITVVSSSKETAKEAVDSGFAEIKKLEALLNYFSAESEITAINKAAGKTPVRVSAETLDIVEKAASISDFTDGAFNPAIGPIIKLWGFSKQKTVHPIPSVTMIEDTLKLVDHKKIKINKDTSEIYLDEEGMEIDLGGIAKGYAADRAIDIIKSKGIRSALVAVAGDIKGIGLKTDRKPWKVGIQDPRSGEEKSEKRGDEIIATLRIRDNAVSTSGDYQRFFIRDGKRYHHIIDPRTGYPTASRVISVSVIASEGYIADGLSTGVFVLGPKKGITLLESLGLNGIIVDIDKNVYLTKSLKGQVSLLHKGYSIAEQ
jgi:thiamine biosynthesis lipoprotein